MDCDLQLLDANVLLEILMGRQYSEQCKALITLKDRNNAISAATVHITWYFAERYKLIRTEVSELLMAMKLVPVDQAVLAVADARYDGRDYEDCLQAACAEAAGCSRIITLDTRFAEHSGTTLPVVHPTERH